MGRVVMERCGPFLRDGVVRVDRRQRQAVLAQAGAVEVDQIQARRHLELAHQPRRELPLGDDVVLRIPQQRLDEGAFKVERGVQDAKGGRWRVPAAARAAIVVDGIGMPANAKRRRRRDGASARRIVRRVRRRCAGRAEAQARGMRVAPALDVLQRQPGADEPALGVGAVGRVDRRVGRVLGDAVGAAVDGGAVAGAAADPVSLRPRAHAAARRGRGLGGLRRVGRVGGGRRGEPRAYVWHSSPPQGLQAMGATNDDARRADRNGQGWRRLARHRDHRRPRRWPVGAHAPASAGASAFCRTKRPGPSTRE